VPDRPAIRRRRARHPRENVVASGSDVGRRNEGPRGPVPVLDEGLDSLIVGVIASDGPAVGLGDARHAVEKVLCLRAAEVGRGDDRPVARCRGTGHAVIWPRRARQRCRPKAEHTQKNSKGAKGESDDGARIEDAGRRSELAAASSELEDGRWEMGRRDQDVIKAMFHKLEVAEG
jgi:hypothetical protein